MRPAVTLIDGPGSEPLTLVEIKAHLRVTHADEDTLIAAYLRGARRAIETRTGMTLLQQTWEAAWPCFPGVSADNPRGGFVMPRPPLLSVTSVKYIDSGGTETTLAASEYTVDARAFPGEVVLAFDKSWPVTRDVPNAVVIRFVAGFGTEGGAVPESIRDAVRLETGDRYRLREDADTEGLVSRGAVRSLLANEQPYVV